MNRDSISDADARKVIEDGAGAITQEDLQQVIEKEEEIQEKFQGPLGRFLGDAKTLIAMVKDYWSKTYREAPWWTIGAAATALLYVLNPLDLVPDFIPFVGLLDDATVVSACLFMLERDLVKYRNWKSTRPRKWELEE